MILVPNTLCTSVTMCAGSLRVHRLFMLGSVPASQLACLFFRKTVEYAQAAALRHQLHIILQAPSAYYSNTPLCSWVSCSLWVGQRHNWRLSLSPGQRAMHIGLPTTGQTVPLQLPLLEATMRAELLIPSYPKESKPQPYRKVPQQSWTLYSSPSRPTCHRNTTVEAPLRASKHCQEALTTLRSWRQQVITVVNDLGGNPEPLKLHSSLRTLISSLVSSKNAFAAEVTQIFEPPKSRTIALMRLFRRQWECWR